MFVSALPGETRAGEIGLKCNNSLILFSQVVQKQIMGGKLDGHLIASCVENTGVKNY